LAERVALVFALRGADDQHALSGLPELVVDGLNRADARVLLESTIPATRRPSTAPSGAVRTMNKGTPASRWPNSSRRQLVLAGRKSLSPRCPGLEERTRAAGTDWALGIFARSRALVSEGDVADGLYREAIERLERTRMRVELARARLLYGEWLRREHRRVEARGRLRAAYDTLVAFGAEAFAERTRRELLATGETVRKRIADTREGLTPQEARQARHQLPQRARRDPA
jgi:hypothetical protein